MGRGRPKMMPHMVRQQQAQRGLNIREMIVNAFMRSVGGTQRQGGSTGVAKRQPSRKAQRSPETVAAMKAAAQAKRDRKAAKLRAWNTEYMATYYAADKLRRPA